MNTKKLLIAKNILDTELDPAFKRRAWFILNNLNLKGKEKILDLGCGRGFYLNLLAALYENAQLTGCDKNSRYLKQAKVLLSGKQNVKLQEADAAKLPFPKNTFDRVIASEILEHVMNDDLVIKEIYRILKPNGTLLITVPNKDYPFLWDPLNWILEKTLNLHIPSDIWWLAGIWADHRRLYSKKELISKLEFNKFKITKSEYATHYSFPYIQFFLYAIGKNLVEMGYFTNFSRFGKKKNKNLLVGIVKNIIYFFDDFNEGGDKSMRSVNILFSAKKEAL